MPLNPRETGKVRVVTIRPFGGRNSDTDAMSIGQNEASGGSNFRVERGVLNRRPSFSAIGPSLSIPGGSVANEVFNIVPFDSDNTSEFMCLAVTRLGVFRLFTPNFSQSSYSSGTISFTSGSTSLNGSGTAWLSRGIHPGASLTSGSLSFGIRSVRSENRAELSTAASSTASAQTYRAAVYGAASTSGGSVGSMAARVCPLDVVRYWSFTSGLVLSEATSPRQTTAGGGTVTVNMTRGDNFFTTTNGPIQTLLQHRGMIYFAGDTGSEVDGIYRYASRRMYRAAYSDDNRVDLSERYRGPTLSAVQFRVRAGLHHLGPTQEQSGGTTSFNHFRVTMEKSLPSGSRTVTATAGTTSITGTGFQRNGFAAGDEILISGRSHVLQTITSDIAATLATPFDQATGSYTYRARFYRNVRIDGNRNPDTESDVASLSAGLQSQEYALARFIPYIWSVGSTPDRRPSVTLTRTGNANPEIPDAHSVCVITTGELSVNQKHNMYALYPDSDDRFTMWEVSSAAPQARFVEAFGSRIFYADVLRHYQGPVATTLGSSLVRDRSLCGWSRANEYNATWNEFANDASGVNTNLTSGRPTVGIRLMLGLNLMVQYLDDRCLVFNPTGDSVNPFSINVNQMDDPPASHESVLNFDNAHIYLSKTGRVIRFDGSSQVVVPSPVSDAIRDTMTDRFANWTMGVHDISGKRLLWFFPGGSNRNLTHACVWGYEDNNWFIWDFSSTPLTTVAYVPTTGGVTEDRIWGANTSARIVAFREASAPGIDFAASIGGGTRYTTEWISKEFVLPVPEQDSEPREKNVTAVGLVYDPASSGRIRIDVSRNGGANWINFADTTLVAGSSGTSQVFGNGMAVGNTHMVRLRQTPLDTTSNSGMAIRAVRIYYEDYADPAR